MRRARPLGHEPARTLDWDCLACGSPWPCEQAREKLKRTHDAVQLGIVMGGELERAVAVLPWASPAALFERFLRWTR